MNQGVLPQRALFFCAKGAPELTGTCAPRKKRPKNKGQ